MPTHGNVPSGPAITTTASELSTPSGVEGEWKYAVGAYEFGDTSLGEELCGEHPNTGEFGDHLLSVHQQGDQYVVSCPVCARRVEVAGDYSAEQRRAVGMYAIGHFLARECDPVDISEVEDFYLGKMSTTATLKSLKHDLTNILVEESEVLRHGD